MLPASQPSEIPHSGQNELLGPWEGWLYATQPLTSRGWNSGWLSSALRTSEPPTAAAGLQSHSSFSAQPVLELRASAPVRSRVLVGIWPFLFPHPQGKASNEQKDQPQVAFWNLQENILLLPSFPEGCEENDSGTKTMETAAPKAGPSGTVCSGGAPWPRL